MTQSPRTHNQTTHPIYMFSLQVYEYLFIPSSPSSSQTGPANLDNSSPILSLPSPSLSSHLSYLRLPWNTYNHEQINIKQLYSSTPTESPLVGYHITQRKTLITSNNSWNDLTIRCRSLHTLSWIVPPSLQFHPEPMLFLHTHSISISHQYNQPHPI